MKLQKHTDAVPTFSCSDDCMDIKTSGICLFNIPTYSASFFLSFFFNDCDIGSWQILLFLIPVTLTVFRHTIIFSHCDIGRILTWVGMGEGGHFKSLWHQILVNLIIFNCCKKKYSLSPDTSLSLSHTLLMALEVRNRLIRLWLYQRPQHDHISHEHTHTHSIEPNKTRWIQCNPIL